MAQKNSTAPADKKDKNVQIDENGLKKDGTEIYMGDTTLQTPEEHKEDENTDPEKGDGIILGEE
ncbi:hypothetical protein SAMN05518672_102271 [Chitinophaga sp. CF118]|uniref:hypothetical protein n=1 Tax=Chitinophaga sp. CF118 TaxID=1884367 RepID=UPI0008F39267|nr:hypothetical protein [Chitinophaga sp. CF118]SFD51895.1 hypothetical protein SAMN05518672_102271 [Chitinophaga sp. CF118]